VLAGKAMYRKHYLGQVWRANYRRIRRSDPDLFELLESSMLDAPDRLQVVTAD
jgi:hypothetical protein